MDGRSDQSTRHKRPAMTRRQTPVSGQKLGRSHRERDRERHDTWDDERESFPQFCMTCEKQFVPHDEKFLYCSDSCRRIDQKSGSHSSTSQARSYSISAYQQMYSPGNTEPRDIIPRASPSRPNSMHFSQSPPASPGTKVSSHPAAALAALRSLTIGPPSPPSPTSSQAAGLWPFARSAASPTDSQRRPSAPYPSYPPSTYGASSYGHESGASSHDGPPLPTRHPGAYSRPKSIELVTPMLGGR